MSTDAAQSGNAAPESGTVTDGELQVTYPLGPSIRPKRSVVAAEGVLPRDDPLRTDVTRCNYDRRLLAPFSIRFVPASEGDSKPGWVGEGELRRAVWRAVAQMMQKKGLQGSMPRIIFDQDPLDNGKRYGCIDIVFDSPLVWEDALVHIETIKMEKPGQTTWKMVRSVSTNSIPGTILAFDVLRLPMSAADSKAVLKSFKHMTAAVGSVTGIGYHKTSGPALGFPYAEHDAVRGYIALSPASLMLSHQAFVELLPTHFKWKGLPYTMVYAGRDLHETAKYSAEYPSEDAIDGDGLSSSSSTASTGQASSPSDSTDGGGSKRRRSRR